MRIDRTYKYDVKVVGGVAFDGKDVWFSDPGNNAIACVDRKTGKIRKRLTGPKIGSGTAWDGRYLWQVGDGKIQCIDPESGKIVRKLPLPDEGFISGLAWDGEALWAGAYDRRKLYKIHPRTGKVLRVLDSDRFVTGITWVGDELWHAVYKAEGKPAEIRMLDARDGRVLRRVPVPCTISGMAYDGDRFWCGDCDEATLRSIQVGVRKKAARSSGSW